MPLNWGEMETRWQRAWEEARIFEADPDPSRAKCFVTFPFPYMSGPFHVGGAFTAVRVDAYARYMRMKGFNVLFPWAWHWTGKTVSGASERVKMGDAEFIRALREVDGVPEEHLKRFIDPAYMARYYTDYNRVAVKRLGLSIDWRREFHTSSLHPAFSKFVEWQYEKLREKGYVARGTHPVVWCPKDESPTGDADRLEGEGVRPTEFILLKFDMEGIVLPCATLRPETIYGVTNVWINPEAAYVDAQVNGERWIISKPCAFKLSHQAKKLKVIREFQGKELVGKECKDPVTRRSLPILPAWFVNPDQASGLVYSVPAHAPYDWIALRDLQRDPEAVRRFNIPEEKVAAIKPISMISLEGFGEYPAVEVAQRMGIADQRDPKADEATKEIYKREFHEGILKEICGKYAGKRVSEVKDAIIRDFTESGIADLIYELPAPVVCRCTTPCIVKIFEDQWFLRYSDAEWKVKAREAIKRMRIYPEEARRWFEDAVDWLQDWACVRKTGLGTPLPWSPDWLVETLSDSTVYMAFYTIAKYVNRYGVRPDDLTAEALDYIFYGEGDPNQISRDSGMDRRTLEAMREEFAYWYPVDLRNSAKDLVPNHLTFYIFHHVALFDPEYWPRTIGVNGFMKVEGEPMHKSRGNFIPIRTVVEEHGADPARCTLMLAAEGMDDPDWRWDNLKELKSKLEQFHNLADDIISMKGSQERSHMDRWLASILQSRIKRVEESLEVLRTRTALSTALYDVWNDLRWYRRRTEQPNGDALKEFLSMWVRLMAPFAPHICEEIWRKIGGKGFVSVAEWPSYDESKVEISAEEAEEIVRAVLEDTFDIMRATGIIPKRICYYSAAAWKWDIYLRALAMGEEGRLSVETLMKELMEDQRMKPFAKQIQKLVPRIVKEIEGLAPQIRRRRLSIGALDETKILSEAGPFFRGELKAEIDVYYEADPSKYDPKGRSSLALPHRPAIYLE